MGIWRTIVENVILSNDRNQFKFSGDRFAPRSPPLAPPYTRSIVNLVCLVGVPWTRQASSYLIYDRTIDNSWIYRERPIGYTRIIEPFSPSVTAWLNPAFGKYRWSPPPSSSLSLFFFLLFPPILFALVSSFLPPFSTFFFPPSSPGNMNVPRSHRGWDFYSVPWNGRVFLSLQ